MDANKLAKLKEIGYTIHQVCGLCVYFQGRTEFGDCTQFTYEHIKHSAVAKNLSVHKFGTCVNFEIDEEKLLPLHSYVEFVDHAS